MTLGTVTLTLDQLRVSPRNVRTDRLDAESVDSLAASIASVGLFQPMVVIKRKGSAKPPYEVLAGGRRFRALTQLVTAGTIPADRDYTCTLVTNAAQVTEISLAENYARRQMRNPEIYAAFAAIRAERPNATVEELGAMFNFDAARTNRILRLANLAPVVMAAYAAGELADDQAMAYAATSDQPLQEAVFAELSAGHPSKHHAHAIRKAMKVGSHDLTTQLLFVGVEAYEAAGGRFEADLFGKEGEGRVLDETLLGKLVEERLSIARDAYEHKLRRNGRAIGEKWGTGALLFNWATKPPQITQYGYDRDDDDLRIGVVKRDKLDEATARHAEDLDNSIANLAAILSLEGDAAPADREDIAAQHQRLKEARDEIEDARPIVLPKQGAIVGVMAIVGTATRVQLWYASRKEKGAALPAGARQRDVTVTPAMQAQKAAGLSNDSVDVMRTVYRDMIRAQLTSTAIGGSTIANDFVIYTQARSILLAKPDWQGEPYASGEAQGVTNAMKQAFEVAKLRAPTRHHPSVAMLENEMTWLRATDSFSKTDPVAGWRHYQYMEQDDVKRRAAALVAGWGLLRALNLTGHDNRMVLALANDLSNDMGKTPWRDLVALDEAFFARLPNKRRIELLNEWGVGDRAKGLKPAETAEFCARIVNCDEADKHLFGIHEDDYGEVVGWMPEFLETPPPAPLPTAAPEDSDDQVADA